MADANASGLHYRAFITYSHQDERWARWLQRALESYRVPSRLVGEATTAGVLPERLSPVFRDRDELPSDPDLDARIREALEQSVNLIVVCSPAAVASRWVNAEIEAFIELGRVERIFYLIVAGEPYASKLKGRETEECFPQALRSSSGEPIAADVRPGKDGRTNAKLKLIAGMLGIGLDALKQREQQRQIFRWVVATVTTAVVLLITVVLAISALIAQHAAERRQKQAEGLVDYMLGDLNDKLSKVQHLDLLEAVDDRAMEYFKSLPTSDVTQDALSLHARGLTKIGNVRLSQGHLDAALDSYQAAAKLSASLAAGARAQTRSQVAYAEVLGFIGMTYWRKGELDDAQQAFESAEQVLTRARASAPEEPQLLFQLVTIHNNVGHVLEGRGRFGEAAQRYQAMLMLSQQLVSVDPNNTLWATDLGAAHNDLGNLALLNGDLAGAIIQYRSDDDIESALLQKDPADNGQRENMLTARAILGRTLLLAGEIDAARDDLRQAVAAAEQLAMLDPNDSEVVDEMGLYSAQLGRIERLDGDVGSAQKLVSAALDKFDALTTQDPTNADWRLDAAQVHIEAAALARQLGHTAVVESQVATALGMLQALLAKRPDDRTILLAFVTASLMAADMLKMPEQQSRALDALLRTIESTASGRGDPRLMALEVETLLSSARATQAPPRIQSVWATGFREPSFVSGLAHRGISYPVNAPFIARLRASLQSQPPFDPAEPK